MIGQTIRIHSPASLLPVVPVLLGFLPDENTLVVVGTVPDPETGLHKPRVTLRYDLPIPPDPQCCAGQAQHAAGVLAAGEIAGAYMVGYGADEVVTPMFYALAGALPLAGVHLADALRVQAGLYWSYLTLADLSGDGTPVDPASPASLEAAACDAPVLGSRAELAATLAPFAGADGDAMRVAIGRELQHPRRARQVGLAAVEDAIARYRAGGVHHLSHTEAATLAVALRDLRIRDDAWSRLEPEHNAAHIRLWTDLTRLTTGVYAAAPASLLAFCAWQHGDGALANLALDRAQDGDPDYTMAGLLRQLIDCGAPPEVARLPMTPEDVAASYDELEAAEEDVQDPEDDDEHREEEPVPGGPDVIW
jgi:hypothetical protein